MCLSGHLIVVAAGGSSSDAHMESHLTSDAVRSLYSTMTSPVSVTGKQLEPIVKLQEQKKTQGRCEITDLSSACQFDSSLFSYSCVMLDCL